MATKPNLPKDNGNHEIIRDNRVLKMVPFGQMRVAQYAQRQLKPSWANKIYANLDLAMLGNPELSYRDGVFYIMDGQHRIEALKLFFGEGWEKEQLECWVASGLTLKEEAQRFLQLQKRLNVTTMDQFKVECTAQDPTALALYRIVTSEGMNISYVPTVGGSVGCVSTLRRVYDRDGEDVLARVLRTARDAYGEGGYTAHVIDGLGLFYGPYGAKIEERAVVAALKKATGGVNGMLHLAENLRHKTGNSKPQCVGWSVLELVNRDIKGRKLPAWWGPDAGEKEDLNKVAAPVKRTRKKYSKAAPANSSVQDHA